MDCVIPGHSVRLFCSSISCLSKIGKDLYVELDVASGLTLRALNDAKSAYASMRFHPCFFERCSSSPPQPPQPQHHPTVDDDGDSGDVSELMNTASRRGNNSDPNNHHERFSIRIPIRSLAPIVKVRKGVVTLRITSIPSPLRLAFEFLILPKHQQQQSSHRKDKHRSRTTTYTTHNNNGGGGEAGDNGMTMMMRVVHCIPGCDADSVSAVTSKHRASELTSRPRTLLRLLEPLLKLKIYEVALCIDKNAKVLVAQSFHHSDCYTTTTTNNTNDRNHNHRHFQLQQQQQAQAMQHLVKTEASMSMDELDEFFFQDDRNEDDDGEDVTENVNEGVVLVFPVRETRAWLQFASSSLDHNTTAAGTGDSLLSMYTAEPTTMYYHWGGKPIVFETRLISSNSHSRHSGSMSSSTSAFSSQLVLASLDYNLLAGHNNSNSTAPR